MMPTIQLPALPSLAFLQYPKEASLGYNLYNYAEGWKQGGRGKVILVLVLVASPRSPGRSPKASKWEACVQCSRATLLTSC
jgi:hypothetical protein